MKINSKLNELKPTDLNCNVFDIYNYNGLSMQELLCQFFSKINECIKVSNETIDLASWLVNEGLEIEVVKKLMLWLEDGTLENLINVNLFKSLTEQIQKNKKDIEIIKSEYLINPEEFEGDDNDKLQASIDKAIALTRVEHYNNYTYPVITLKRDYYITKPLVFKDDDYWGWFKIQGEGGGIVQSFNGYMFDLVKSELNPVTHAPVLENLRITSTGGLKCCLFDNTKFLRFKIENCVFKSISCINGDGYIQSLRFINNITDTFGGSEFIQGFMAYDVEISNNMFEGQTSEYSVIKFIEEQYNQGISYMSLRINNNVIENHRNAKAIHIGTGYGLSICDNYFEDNKINIVIDKPLENSTPNVSGKIKNNTFLYTSWDKPHNERQSIEINTNQTYFLEVDFNTSNDGLFCNKDVRKNGYESHNCLYSGGKLQPNNWYVRTSTPQECIKESNGQSFGVKFKAKVNTHTDLASESGVYTFNLNWKMPNNPYYRGCGEFKVSMGNIYQQNKLMKKLSIDCVSGLGSYHINGANTNGEGEYGYKVYFDDTNMDLIDYNTPFTYITVEITMAEHNSEFTYGNWYRNNNIIVENFING